MTKRIYSLLICFIAFCALNAQSLSPSKYDDYQYPQKIIADSICTICYPSDSLALVALYNSTDGDNWTTSWDLTEAVESWHGVDLSDDCCVIGLDLSRDENNANGNNLIGSIPEEIGNLDSLEYLVLANNDGLMGSIPPTIGNLSNLSWMGIYRCNLQDTIPKELAQLSELTYFSASVNQFSGAIPEEIGTMEKLETFFVSYNQLSGTLPIHMSELPNLEGLGLSGNQFTGTIPTEYFNLPKLRFLYLADNQLTGDIPDLFQNFSDLVLLNLNNNNFTGRIPSSIAESTFLTFLDLSENQLVGSIPVEFGNSDFLYTLKLYSNELSGIVPVEVLDNEEINLLYLQDNLLEACYDDMENYCSKDFREMPSDTFVHFGDSLYFYNQDGYNFSQNPRMAWAGDITNWCNGEDPIGVTCEDGDSTTIGEVIREDCKCSSYLLSNFNFDNLQQFEIIPNLINRNEPLHIKIQTAESIKLTACIYNSFGQKLKEEKLFALKGENTFQIHLPSISSGIYFVELSDEYGIKAKKFVVE